MVLACVLVFLFLCCWSNAYTLKACKSDKIYQFGDSISGTGNLIRENSNTPFSHLSYGESFYKNVTSRCSNSLHMIDYFASDIELSLLNYFLDESASTDHRVNFAVAECHNKLRNNALFKVGEIGGNDYNFAILGGKTFQEIKDTVPDVVQTIQQAVEKVISYSATWVIIPRNSPIKCLPIYPTDFQTNDTITYDDLHCLDKSSKLLRY
ncbi:unnamed protein product [Citrullus colocynthis]|uniref:Uncharacterized protein n=1 Tax=Citrullus colocynthis TaxID=252529 RepID=A0ABP0Y770_9ROSI